MGIIPKKAGVEHIDTNIVIRLITGDDPKNYEKAKKLISKKGKTYVLEDAAIMEVVFVLSGNTYHFSREEVATGIKFIMGFNNIYFNKSIVTGALDIYVSHPKLSFTDCYLAIITETSGETPLWTLDHKLAAQCKVAKEI